MSNPINDIMTTSMNGIKDMVDVNTVIGDAVQTPDGSVIIPVCKVCFGIATGGAEYNGSIDFTNPVTGPVKPLDDKFIVPVKYPFAGGCATGVSITPVAFIKSGGGNVQLIPIDNNNTVEKLINLIPDLLNKILTVLENKMGEKNSRSQEDESGACDCD